MSDKRSLNFPITDTCIFLFLLFILSAIIPWIGFSIVDVIYADATAIGAQYNGLTVSIFTFISHVISCYFLVKLIRFRLSVSVCSYLGFIRVGVLNLILWCLLVFGYIYAVSVVTTLFDISIKSNFFSDLYKSTGYGWVVVIFVVITAPIFEEVMFRGYMYSGCVNTMGVLGAVVLTSAVWASIHLQYSFIQQFYLYVFGLLLGFARYKTRSTIVPICMHITLNLVAVTAFLAE